MRRFVTKAREAIQRLLQSEPSAEAKPVVALRMSEESSLSSPSTVKKVARVVAGKIVYSIVE
jgi:hypothetical protein